MEYLKIMLDSGCDVSKEEAQREGFDVVPLTIVLGKQNIVDYYELDQEKFQAALTAGTGIPSTAQPNPSIFIEYFEKYMADYENIMLVTISTHGSGTYNSATLAKEMFEEKHPDSHCKIYIHDSWSTSYAEVIHAKAAKEMAASKTPMADILCELDKIRRSTASYYVASDIPFLIKSGRVGNLKGAMVAKLGIKPIISIVNGFGVNYAIAMGYQGAVGKLAGYFVKEADESSFLYLTYFNAYDKALEIVEKIRATYPKLRYEINRMWGVMSTHAGPDSVGMFFLKTR